MLLEMQKKDLLHPLLLDAFSVAQRAPVCPAEPELEKARKNRAPETFAFFSRGWFDGALS